MFEVLARDIRSPVHRGYMHQVSGPRAMVINSCTFARTATWRPAEGKSGLLWGQPIRTARGGASRLRRNASRLPVCGPARLPRAARVSGWSGPRSRSGSAATCSWTAMASPVRPADRYEKARLSRAARVSGWSGPRSRSRVGGDLFLDGDGLAGAPCQPVRGGQVAPGGEGVGVLGAEEACRERKPLEWPGPGPDEGIRPRAGNRTSGRVSPGAGRLRLATASVLARAMTWGTSSCHCGHVAGSSGSSGIARWMAVSAWVTALAWSGPVSRSLMTFWSRRWTLIWLPPTVASE